MAFDEWEHEYHLTLSGWVPGSFYFRGTLARQLEIPADSVLTLVQENLNSSAQAGLKTTWRLDWKSPDREQIEHLLDKFGKRPQKGSHPTLAL
jgi:hypothetical protein